jgi:hypothetical protein
MRDAGGSTEAAGGAPAPPTGRFYWWVTRTFLAHMVLFIVLNAVLLGVNLTLGTRPLWAVWWLLGTAVPAGLHFLLYKALTVDEAWIEARVEELNVKSYDRGHIEDIKRRHEEAPRPSHRSRAD